MQQNSNKHPLISHKIKQDVAFTDLDNDLALQVCEGIASGELLKDLCKLKGYPAKITFMRWCIMFPPISRAFVAAKQLSAFSHEEEAIDLLRKSAHSPGSAQKVSATRALADQLKWTAERRAPAEYGNRAPVSITVPIQINTTLDLEEGGSVLKDETSVYSLEAVQTKDALQIEDQSPMKPPMTPGEKSVKAQWGHKRKLTPQEPQNG